VSKVIIFSTNSSGMLAQDLTENITCSYSAPATILITFCRCFE